MATKETNNSDGSISCPLAQTSANNVFESNNLGVAHLMDGNLEQAHRHFLEAFEQTSMHIRVLAEEEEEGDSTSSHPVLACNKAACCNPCPETNNQVATCRKPSLPRNLLVNTIQRALSDFDNPRKHALMISVSNDEDGNSGQEDSIDWSLVSAFVVYNLGVLYLSNSPPSLEPYTRRRNDDQCHYLRRSQVIFASTKALLQQATRSSSLELTGNPLVDLLSLLTAYKLAETTMDLEGESELQERYSNELLELGARLGVALGRSTFYNDAEVAMLLRLSCQQLVLQCTLLGRRDPSSSAAAA